MAKPKRLTPKPTNTRLARFVGRMVRRWPLAFASTVRERDAHINKLDREVQKAWQANQEIYRDMGKMLHRMAPPIPRFVVNIMRDELLFEARVRIDFRPVCMNFTNHEMRDLFEPGPHTRYMLDRCARDLSRLHAQEIAPAILENLNRAVLNGKTRDRR